MPSKITYFDDFEGPNPYCFLSNFYVGIPLKIGSRDYATGEHAFQAYKAQTWKMHDAIRSKVTPSGAKSKGRSIPLRPDWEAVKYDVMRVVLFTKFPRGSYLAAKLLETGNALLVEGNDWNDRVWGVSRKTATGRNWLGTLLMARRAELQADEDMGYASLLSFIRIPS